MANELDGFMAAASERLGEECMRNASRAASSGRSMELPGVGREHQAGLDELACSFIQAQEAEKWQARQEERERKGLMREPEQDRERQRPSRGLGLGR